MPYAFKDYASGATVLVEVGAAYLGKIDRDAAREALPAVASVSVRFAA